MIPMVGERIRQIRLSQERPLSDVAGKAKISVATLSRIETDKQAVDLGLFLVLAKVLKVTAHELLGDSDGEPDGKVDPLARRIAALETKDRAELWRELAIERRVQRSKKKTTQIQHVGVQVDELLAQIDFLREELEAVRSRIRRRR